MKFQTKKRLTLLTELYHNKTILEECCQSITLGNTKYPLWDIGEKRTFHEKSIYYSIKNVPEYFNVTYLNPDKNRIIKFPSVKGYAICLDNYSNIDAYIKDKFSKKGQPLKTALNRLETCFDIKYVIFHDTIDRETYNLLFNRLREMIITRFVQRNEKSDTLNHWDLIFETSYELINKKEATLFVIYHGEKPIAISLNYNYGNVLFSYVSSFDIDYYKFSLGQIEIYKQLEWCLKHQYRFFELGWGDLEYKRHWCNYIYTFEHHFVFSKKSISGHLSSLLEGSKTSLIAFLISKKVNIYFKKVKNLIKLDKPSGNSDSKLSLGEIQKGKFEDSNYIPLELTSLGTRFLNFHIYNFIYSTQEKYHNTLLYQKDNTEYMIQGKNSYQKVTIKS